MPLILKILGVKAIGTIVGIIVLLTRSTPGLSILSVGLDKDSVTIETSLKNGFNEGLEDIIMSGSEVIVLYSGALLEKDSDGNVTTIKKKTMYQSIVYIPTDNKFNVSIGQDTSFYFEDLDTAKEIVSLAKMRLVPVTVLVNNRSYSVKVDVSLNTIEIEAIDAKQFDLNAFWNFKYPLCQSDWIERGELLK